MSVSPQSHCHVCVYILVLTKNTERLLWLCAVMFLPLPREYKAIFFIRKCVTSLQCSQITSPPCEGTINTIKAYFSLSALLDLYLCHTHTHTHSVGDMFNMLRQDRETLMRRGFTVVKTGVMTCRLPRLDGLYRRDGQLDWSCLELCVWERERVRWRDSSVFYIYFYVGVNWNRIVFFLVFVDGGQQFLLFPERMVYRMFPPHCVVVLCLYETRLVCSGWPVNECSQLKLGHTGHFCLHVPSPSHDGVILCF